LVTKHFTTYPGNLMGKLLHLISMACLVGLTRRVGNFFMLFEILLNCWAIVMNSILV